MATKAIVIYQTIRKGVKLRAWFERAHPGMGKMRKETLALVLLLGHNFF
jgi:hypothetical protein